MKRLRIRLEGTRNGQLRRPHLRPGRLPSCSTPRRTHGCVTPASCRPPRGRPCAMASARWRRTNPWPIRAADSQIMAQLPSTDAAMKFRAFSLEVTGDITGLTEKATFTLESCGYPWLLREGLRRRVIRVDDGAGACSSDCTRPRFAFCAAPDLNAPRFSPTYSGQALGPTPVGRTCGPVGVCFRSGRRVRSGSPDGNRSTIFSR